MSAALALALAALVFATSFLAGVLGMAGGMILMGVLVALLPVPSAMILHAVAQGSSNGWRAALWWRHIDLPILARYAAGLVAGLALFAAFRFVPDRAVVLAVLGLSPFVVLLLPEHAVPRADRRGGAELCGLVCTALQYLSGVSGPTLDVFFVRTQMGRREVVATKAACQVVTHVSRLVYFGALGPAAEVDLGWPVFALSVAMAVAGTSASRGVLERISDAQFRRWTRLIVMLIGAVYCAQAVHAFVQG